MKVKCIKEYCNKLIKLNEEYKIRDADMYKYLIEVGSVEIWISKDDIEHFSYQA